MTCPNSAAMTHCGSTDNSKSLKGSIVDNTTNICISQDPTNKPQSICCDQSGKANMECTQRVSGSALGGVISVDCAPDYPVMTGCMARNVIGILREAYIDYQYGCTVRDTGSGTSVRAVAIWYDIYPLNFHVMQY